MVKHVLPVKEDEAIAEVVWLSLHESGSAVDCVSTVADAMVSVHGEAPAAVLLGLTLTGESGISSLRVCRESRALANVPIVVLSGTPIPEFHDGLAPDAVVRKPFNIDHLCALVDQLTRGDEAAEISCRV